MKLINKASQKTQDSVQDILDTFSGVDGGVSFCNLCRLIEDIDTKATQGDEAAIKILDSIYKFAVLIKIANEL